MTSLNSKLIFFPGSFDCQVDGRGLLLCLWNGRHASDREKYSTNELSSKNMKNAVRSFRGCESGMGWGSLVSTQDLLWLQHGGTKALEGRGGKHACFLTMLFGWNAFWQCFWNAFDNAFGDPFPGQRLTEGDRQAPGQCAI